MDKIEGTSDANWEVMVTGAIDRGLAQGQAP